MNENEFLAQEIFSRYGSVRRARGAFLYTAKGVRVTDLFQEEGRAILGWGGNSSFTVFKNVLNRGITGSYRTDFTRRLEKAVSDLFGDERIVFAFYTKRSLSELKQIFSGEATLEWRPWFQPEIQIQDADMIFFAPPLPWCGEIFLLAAKPRVAQSIPESARSLLCAVPAPLEAALARSIYNLISALQTRQEKDFFIYDSALSKYFERKGPYLFPKIPRESYKEFILHCLDLGIAISPCFDTPSIVPFGADRGVFSCLKKNPFHAEN